MVSFTLYIGSLCRTRGTNRVGSRLRLQTGSKIWWCILMKNSRASPYQRAHPSRPWRFWKVAPNCSKVPKNLPSFVFYSWKLQRIIKKFSTGFEFVSPNYRSHVLQQPLQEPGNAASGPSSTFSGLRESIDSAEIIEPPVQEWQLRRNEYASLQVSRPYKPKLCVKAIEEELNMAININNVKNSMNTKYLLFPSKMVPVPTQCEGDTIMTKFRKLTASKKNETAPAIHEVKRTQRFPAYLRQNCRRSDRLAAKLRVNFKYWCAWPSIFVWSEEHSWMFLFD